MSAQGTQSGPCHTLEAASPGEEGFATASYPRSAHLLTPWGMSIMWTSQVSCGPHGYRVDLTGIMWPHQRGMIKGGPPVWHQVVLWAPSAAGCPRGRVAGSAQNTLPAQAIPPRSRTWHSGGVSLTARRGWHKLGGFNSTQRAGPLPEEHRAPELSWLLGAGLGEHSKATTSPSASCALMPDSLSCGTGKARVTGLSSITALGGWSSCQGGVKLAGRRCFS